MKSSRMRRMSSALTIALVVILMTSLMVSAQSTTKQLSTNFTLVNLNNGPSTGSINYYTGTGAQWKPSETFSFAARGDSKVYRQYTDAALSSGQGSVVVGASGPMGAVVQIQARQQVPTSGAYSGTTQGATEVVIPLVIRKGSSAQGTTNSQIVVQNTGGAVTNVEIDLISRATGASQFKKTFSGLAPGASVTYDLSSESATNVPDGFLGSAVVKPASGGTITAVSNFFLGSDAMQTFNGFATPGTKWIVPLFAVRLPNGLSTPLIIQSLSDTDIAAGGIALSCKPDPTSSSQAVIDQTNNVAVKKYGTFEWNPVTNESLPAGWQGACTVTTSANTVAFVQMRFVGTQQAAAYEGFVGTSTDNKVIVPLYMKRLPNGFATVVTVANLGTADTQVVLTYKPNTDSSGTTCNVTVEKTIPAGGSIIQNHFVDNANPNAVPALSDGCQGSITIEPKAGTTAQPIVAFTQIRVAGAGGDPFMAHNNFTFQ